MKNKQMWEILVPTVSNDGVPFKTKFHKVWDAKVYALTGGITVLTPAKGRWVGPEGTLFAERMIPVKIVATRKEIDEIIDFTIKYYNQEAVLAYKVSDEVILKYKDKS